MMQKIQNMEKPKLNKKTALMSVAAITAAALTVTGIYGLNDRAQDMEVYAKESFSGMKEIVEEHGEKNPFTILDISPTKALYPLSGSGNTYKLSTGTIGYLTPGQAPIERDIQAILEDNTAFYEYEKRMELVETIVPTGYEESDFLRIAYEEAYGGTIERLDERKDWIKLYDPVEADGPAGGSVPTGRLTAYVIPADPDAGEDGAYQYDGDLIDGLEEMEGTLYTFSDSGEWHVTFVYDPDAVSGYVPVMLACDDFSSYSSTTGVYYKNEDGTFEYVGTKSQILGLPEENTKPPKGDQDKTEQDKDKEDGKKPGDGGTTGDAGDGTPGDDGGDNAGGDDNTGSDGGDNTGGDGGDNTGGDGGDNTGSDGGDNTGSDGGDNTDGDSGDNTGSDGGDNTGGDSGDNTGSDGGNHTSGDNGDNTGSDGGNHTSSDSGDNAGSDGGNHTSSDSGNNTGSGSSGHGESSTAGSSNASDRRGDSEEESASARDSASAEASAVRVRWQRLIAEDGDEGDKQEPENPDGTDNPEMPEDPDNTENPEEPENPGDTNKPEDPDNTNEPENPEDTNRPEDSGNSNESEDSEEEEERNQNAGPDYYILEFRYESEPSEDTKLYSIKDKEKIPDWDGAVLPYDRYDIDGSVSGDADAGDGSEDEEGADDAVTFDVDGEDLPVFKYVGTGGNCNLKPASVDDADYDEDKAEEVEVENAPVYFKCCKGNDWLERYVFNALEDQDNYYDQFAIEVVSVTAPEVTAEMVEEADLIYLESGIGVFINSGASLETIGPDNGGMDDISEAAILAIVKSAVTELKPVIVDYDIISDTRMYPDSDYQKLARIFLKEDLSGFYYDMGEEDLLDDLFRGLESDDYEDNEDNSFHYVNRNVYMVNGESPLASEDFPESFDDDYAKRGFREVLIAIRAENTMLKEDDWLEEEVSKARAVAYIINYSVGMIGDYRNVAILELQPTANGNENSDLHVEVNEDRKTTTLYWQKQDSAEAGQQIFRATKVVDVSSTVKSVAEFNGEWEDINSVYDMVFIGLDGQKLYQEGRDKHTVYNDSSLNEKVYHTGDQAAGKDGRYDASDITEQKKEALLDYLRAGYPVVVEDNCMNIKKSDGKEYRSVNQRYIADNTQMYAFLEEALEHYGDYLYTVREVRGNPEFRAQLNVVKPRIDYQEETGIIQSLTQAEDGRYEGTILYKVTGNQDEEEDNTYHGDTTLRLYLDLNYDGVFTPLEELQPTEETGGYVGGDGQVTVRFDGMESGIIPWKLEISDTNNGYRRDSLTGYFTMQGKAQTPVSILQILDDKENKYANLQKNMEDIRNSTLRRHLEMAENKLNVKYEIETITTAELSQRIAANGKYLDQWDILVLGFGKSGSLGEAQSAVTAYIEEGRSVLISYTGAAEEMGRLGLEPTLLGQANDMTYSKLGRGGGEYYRYQGLKAEMFETPMSALQAQKINEGSICYYPFEVGSEEGTAFFSDVTNLFAPEYLLDFTGNTGDSELYVTGWYTLNDNGMSDGGGYKVSPRDARNNYYIYSRANVVYVGQNEYPYFYERDQGEEPKDGVDECKLFVNALMAAYNAGIHNPKVDIVAGFGNGAPSVESIAIPFDQEFKSDADVDGGILDETVDVYFKFVDNNIAFDKEIQISFYYENGTSPDAALVLPDGSINTADFTAFASPVWMVENNHLVEVTGDFKQGVVYRIKAPVIALKGNDEEASRIFIALDTRYKKGGKERHAIGTDVVALTRAQMFLLE